MAIEALIFLGFFMFLILFFIAMFAFWIWMIIDCAKRDFKKNDDRIIWLLVIVLVQILGAVIYYFIIKRKDKK